MTSFPDRVVPVSELLLDLDNPRLPDRVETQIDAIRANGERQGAKLEVLCRDILDRGGLNPFEQPCVLRVDAGFTVLEGNRRVLALKILHEPDLLHHIPNLDGPTRKRIRELSERFKKRTIDRIRCVEAPSREAADPWIELKHSGELGGAGLVGWSVKEKQRWEARRTGKRRPELQVLDFVKDHLPTEEQEKVPDLAISTLGRLVSDPDFRKAMGLVKADDGLTSVVHPKALTQGLVRVVSDMLDDDFTVKRVYYKADRRKYLDDIREDLPRAEDKTEEWSLDDAPSFEPPEPPKPRRPRRRTLRRRTRLIPKHCVLHILKDRVDGLYRELSELNLDDFPNVAWVNIRVLLELSLNCFIRDHEADLPVVPDDAILSYKLQVVARHLQDIGAMSRDSLKPIRKIAEKGKHYMYASIPTLNDAAHDENAVPRVEEMIRAWDEIQPLMEVLWPPQAK